MTANLLARLPGSVFSLPQRGSLGRDCRYPLPLRRSQHNQATPMMTAPLRPVLGVGAECLHRHKPGVGKADHAVKAIRHDSPMDFGLPAARNAECDVNAGHHRQRRLPLHKHRHGINKPQRSSPPTNTTFSVVRRIVPPPNLRMRDEMLSEVGPASQ